MYIYTLANLTVQVHVHMCMCRCIHIQIWISKFCVCNTLHVQHCTCVSHSHIIVLVLVDNQPAHILHTCTKTRYSYLWPKPIPKTCPSLSSISTCGGCSRNPLTFQECHSVSLFSLCCELLARSSVDVAIGWFPSHTQWHLLSVFGELYPVHLI